MNTFAENPLNPQAGHIHNYPLSGLELLADKFIIQPYQNEGQPDVKVFDRELKEEVTRLKVLLKSQAFGLGNKEFKEIVQRYHVSLTRLLDDVSPDIKVNNTSAWEELYSLYIHAVEAILEFINSSYPEHCNPDEPVPLIYLIKQRKQLIVRLNKIEKMLLQHPEEMAVGEIFRRVRRFAASGSPMPFKVRYRDLQYKEELLRQLGEMQWKNQQGALFTPVESILIYLNYNSKAFIRLLVRKITNEINDTGDTEDKLDILLRYRKAFKQIHSKPGVVLNPGYHPLAMVLEDWFDEEVVYLEKKIWLTKIHTADDRSSSLKQNLKVLLSLSSDQAALVIRGADEARIIIAKSMSAVFKSIAPYISTPYREHVSPEGMRSKAYHPEQHDKDKAIAALEAIIKKIKGY